MLSVAQSVLPRAKTTLCIQKYISFSKPLELSLNNSFELTIRILPILSCV